MRVRKTVGRALLLVAAGGLCQCGERTPPQGEPAPPPAAPPPAARPAAHILLLYAAALAAALPCYVFLATERYTLLARLIAWAGLGLSFLPAVTLLAAPSSRRNGVAATGLVVALFYHMGVFHERRLLLRWGEARISSASVELALLMAALCVPLLWAGWALCGAFRLPRLAPRLRLPIAPRRLRDVGIVIVLWSALVHLLWLRGQITTYQPAVSVISALVPIELGFAMLVVHQLGGHATRRDRLIFWGLMAMMAAISLALGMILVVVRPFLVYLLGWLLLGRRVRLLPVAAVLGAVLLMQPVKGEFRQKVWDRPTSLGVVERVLLYVDLIERHWLGGELDPEVDKEQSLQVAASRTGASLGLAHVVELTPASVPYQRGATYRYLLYTFAPRLLYPEKPIAQYADIWAAVMYGYTTEAGTAHVMVGLSQLAEAYINFGLLGGALFLLLLGAIYRLCDEVLAHEAAGSGALALYLYYVLNAMIGSEGSFAQFWGGVIQTFLLYGTGLWLLRPRGAAAAPLAAPALVDSALPGASQ